MAPLNTFFLAEAIQQGPDCLIATPGRLNDFVQKKQVCLGVPEVFPTGLKSVFFLVVMSCDISLLLACGGFMLSGGFGWIWDG